MAYTGRVTVDGIVMDSRLPYSDEETGIEISRNETTLVRIRMVPSRLSSYSFYILW